MRNNKLLSVYNILKRRSRKGLTQLDLYLMIGTGKISYAQFTSRLGAVVFTLKNDHKCRIDSVWERNKKTGTRYKRYFLVKGMEA